MHYTKSVLGRVCNLHRSSTSVSGVDVATAVVTEREYYYTLYLCSDKPLSHTCGAHVADRYMALWLSAVP